MNSFRKLVLSRLFLATALVATCGLMSTPAHAGAMGFTGGYAYGTWTASNTVGAPTVSSIDLDNQVLTLREPNAGADNFPGNQTFDFTHTILASGVVSFDWDFNWDNDTCCSGFNVYVNGTLHRLANGYPGDAHNSDQGSTSGTFSMYLQAGDVLDLASFSQDGLPGAATTTISQFNAVEGEAPAPSTVPEPSSLALLSTGIAGFETLRRTRRR